MPSSYETEHGIVDQLAEERERLRDQFAGQAMQAYITSNTWLKEAGDVVQRTAVDPHKLIAKLAYQQADAMIQERNKA